MYDQRPTGPSVGMPIKVPDALELHERLFELRSIFRLMTLTERDLASEIYAFALSLSPSNQWTDRDQYAAGLYSDLLADDAFKKALSAGQLPIWAGRGGTPVELNTRVLFAHNKWSTNPVIRGGVYQPMNHHNQYGDDERAAADGALLWVKDEDWITARDAMIKDRERQSGSELPAEFRSLMNFHSDAGETEQPVTSRLPSDVQRYSDRLWAGHNQGWYPESRKSWPGPDGDTIYLGMAVLEVGRAMFGEAWSDDIATQPRPASQEPFPSTNFSGTALEAFVVEAPLRMHRKAKQLWPMFDAVVERLILAAQEGRLRCFSRVADHLDLRPIGQKSWRLPDSIAVFKRCLIDPARPFAGVPAHTSGHKVFVHAADICSLISGAKPDSAQSAVTASRRRPGNRRWDWKAAWAYLAVEADLDGFGDKSQADIERMLADWFSMRYNGAAPVASHIRKEVNRFFQAQEEREKSKR